MYTLRSNRTFIDYRDLLRVPLIETLEFYAQLKLLNNKPAVDWQLNCPLICNRRYICRVDGFYVYLEEVLHKSKSDKTFGPEFVPEYLWYGGMFEYHESVQEYMNLFNKSVAKSIQGI